MQWLPTLGVALGSAWLSGINLYATVLTLGLLQRMGLADLPGDLDVLAEPWVIAAAAVLYAIEFVADKIPVVDSMWDAVHTFVRVPAGAVLAASAFASFEPTVVVIALLAGGGLSLSAHGTKAATRLAANASPEPISNVLLSLAEDVLAVSVAVLTAFHPVVVLLLVGGLVLVSLSFAARIVAGLRRLFRPRSTPAGA